MDLDHGTQDGRRDRGNGQQEEQANEVFHGVGFRGQS
jgi:hypothetical protein